MKPMPPAVITAVAVRRGGRENNAIRAGDSAPLRIGIHFAACQHVQGARSGDGESTDRQLNARRRG